MTDTLQKKKKVAYVERDARVYAYDYQRPAPWGLARISHRQRLNDNTYNEYKFNANGGQGVKVYVVDSGINIRHQDFEGRASWGATFTNDGDYDNHGHGTHCAGTVGGKKFGVAKKAQLIAVKVLGADGYGSNSGIIAGVQYAIQQHQNDARRGDSRFKGSVVNMSLGGGRSQAVDAVVNAVSHPTYNKKNMTTYLSF